VDQTKENVGRVGSSEPKRWLDDKKNIDRMFYVLCGTCAALVLADLGYHKHGHFDFENWIGFHFFYGFAVFAFVVFVGTNLRTFLMRDEDYYAPEREPTPGGKPPSGEQEDSAHG